jgi:Tol biopolymer transport system component
VSSDGGYIAFLVQTDSGQSLRLQTLNLNDGSVEQIGDPETMQGAFDWNPSRSALAYVEIAPDQSSSIQLAQLSGGGNPATLTTLAQHLWVNQLAFSPDGGTLALSVSVLPPGTQPSQVLESSTDLNGTEARVLLLDSATGEMSEIARDDVTDTPSLAWNHDGTRLAYAYVNRVFVYEFAGEQSSTVNWMEDQSLHSPSWLSNSTLVVVSTPTSSDQGSSQAEIVSYDVTSSETRAWSVEPGVAAASVSPDSRYIAYIHGQPSSDPAAQDAGYAGATTTVVLLSVDQSSGRAIYIGESLDRPVWSPDSQTLFVSNGNVFSMFAGNRRQIFALDIASGAVTPLFEGPLATSSLLGWSPPSEGTPAS